MQEGPVKATIRDVAREAKVSVATVSRALNDLPTVTRETRDHVRAVADALGYVPHAGARALSLSRTNVIGVVLPDLHGEFFSELVRGLDRAATARGYHMLFSTAHADSEVARQAILSMHGRVDGLIVMAPHVAPERMAAFAPAGTPAVLISSPPAPGRDALRIDNRGGAAQMTRHLIQAGRRRIVHISGPSYNLDARERREGFLGQHAAQAPGAPPLVLEGDFQEASGAAAVAQLVATGEAFDAVFAANDSMAVGALSALRTAGRRIPQDVALAGFDDVPLARFLDLTTMRVPMSDLGGQAVARLCARLDGDVSQAGEIDVMPELVVRGTTGGAA